MATLVPTLTLVSTDATSGETLNLSVTDSLALGANDVKSNVLTK